MKEGKYQIYEEWSLGNNSATFLDTLHLQNVLV
jgi:hypothetical protein